MNSKNEDSVFSLRLVPECPMVMDGGAQATTEAPNYLRRPSPAYCNATLHLVSYRFIRD